MTEATQVAVQPKNGLAPWGSREEVREIADRLKKFLPGTKKMNDTEIMAFAQLVHMTGLNPCACELHGWDTRGDGTGVLATKLHYGITIRWAKSQENFTTDFTCIAIGSKSEDTIYECQLLRQSDRPFLGQLLNGGASYKEALSWATSKGLGIIGAYEKSKKKPPKGKDWPWMARKRALEDAIHQAFGKPSTQELARQTWIVEGVVTESEDWKDVTPEMTRAERKATARFAAQLRLSSPLKESAQDSIDLLFGSALPETPPEPITGEIMEESPFDDPETAQEATGNNNDIARPADPPTVKKWLAGKAKELKHYRPPTPNQLGLMNGLLSKILGGDKERRSWIAWVWGCESSKDMLGSEVGATLNWLKPVKDAETNQYIPLDVAVQEAKFMLRQAMIDAGQIDMFD